MTLMQRGIGVVGCVTAYLLCISGIGAADIYQSTDAQGHAVYSDRPRSDSDKRITITSSRATAADVQSRTARELAELARTDQLRRENDEAKRAKAVDGERRLAEQAERCQRARNRLLSAQEAHRLYRRDDKGERVYLTAAEIDAERAAAQAQMQEACDGLDR